MDHIIAGLIGVVLGVMFQKPLEKLWEKLLKGLWHVIQVFKQTEIKDPHQFVFGNIETPIVVIDGNGEEVYGSESIVCHYDSKELHLPEDLATIKTRIMEREEANRSKGEPYMWNGQTYGMNKYSIGRTSIHEHLELRLWFFPSNWFTHLATSHSLDKETIIDSQTNNLLTLREKYYSHTVWSLPNVQPVKYFSNTFGIVVALITGDNKIVFVKRSNIVGTRPGVYNIAINEGLQRPFDRSDVNDAPDLHRAVIRGAAEELGLELHRENITFTSFITDIEKGEWAITGYAHTSNTFSEIVKMRSLTAKDRWEGHEIISLNFTVNEVVKFISEHNNWSPGALVCVYYTLVREYGKRAVTIAIERHFKV